MTVSINITSDLDVNLINRINSDVAEIVEEEITEFGIEIAGNAPQGVSDVGDSLRANFDIRPAQITANEINVAFENNLPFSLERYAGRGPGKRPPISALERWAASKNISAYAVAKKIGDVGTDRYIEGAEANDLRIDPRTKQIPTEEGPQAETTDRIVRRVERLSY